MLAPLLIKFKRNHPWLWSRVEDINSVLMGLRYPALHRQAAQICAAQTQLEGMQWTPVLPSDAEALSDFLTSLSGERTTWFAPHPFGVATLRGMAAGNSFLMFKVTYGGRIVGYHFLRCFFTGRAFHGLIVAEEMAGRGIGTRMWALAADICTRNSLAMQATIHRDNTASLTSCRRGCNPTIIATLPDGYLQFHCRPRAKKIKN